MKKSIFRSCFSLKWDELINFRSWKPICAIYSSYSHSGSEAAEGWSSFYWMFFWKTHVGNLEFTVRLWEEIEGPWGTRRTHKQKIWSWESRPGQTVRMTRQTTECVSFMHLGTFMYSRLRKKSSWVLIFLPNRYLQERNK